MFYVEGTCPSCLAGQIGVFRCSDDTTLLLMCDECNELWLDPADRRLEVSRAADTRTFAVPGLLCKVGGGASGWATREEIERAGWQGYIVGEYHRPPLKPPRR